MGMDEVQVKSGSREVEVEKSRGRLLAEREEKESVPMTRLGRV